MSRRLLLGAGAARARPGRGVSGGGGRRLGRVSSPGVWAAGPGERGVRSHGVCVGRGGGVREGPAGRWGPSCVGGGLRWWQPAVNTAAALPRRPEVRCQEAGEAGLPLCPCVVRRRGEGGSEKSGFLT